MDGFYYKHYITFPPVEVGETAIILDGFSTAFKEPLIGDVCINEQAERQFNLLGADNPQLTNLNGCHLYRYENGQVRKATDAELTAELTEIEANKPPVQPTPIEELQAENKLLKAQVQAQTERNDFIEDCIAEMAINLYA